MAGDASEKVAIVTGSTQGLGEAIARRLVDEALIGGLVICGRNGENGERLAREFRPNGCRTQFVRADLAVIEDCRRVTDAARRAFGRIDFLVDSAATSERGTILDTTPELFDRIMGLAQRPDRVPDAGRDPDDARPRQHAGAIVNILSTVEPRRPAVFVALFHVQRRVATLTRNVACSVLKTTHPRQRPQHRLDGQPCLACWSRKSFTRPTTLGYSGPSSNNRSADS